MKKLKKLVYLLWGDLLGAFAVKVSVPITSDTEGH